MSTFHAVSLRHQGQSTFENTLKLRLRVRLTRATLDRQILAGRPCGSTAPLALRSSQLVEPRTRRQIARSLRKVVDYADYRATHRVISAVVLEPAAVRGARQAILGLAERLEGQDLVSPVGVAGVQTLLTDGLSPLFNSNSEQTVTQAIWKIQDDLDSAPHELYL
jgi:L-asparaginase II